jgi:hypothetical protein
MSDSIQYATGGDALSRVQRQATEMAAADDQCERGYAHLGWLLLEVAEMQFWRLHYQTFREYLKEVAMTSRRSPEQLHRYFLTVRDLSDTFSAAQLEAMGISKAMRLRAAKDYALVLPAEVVNVALDPKSTVKDLKKAISVALKMPDEDGDYMDLEFEFMVSPEERVFFEAVMDAAMRTDPVTKSNISKSAQRKDIAMKWAMEYWGTYSVNYLGDGQ